MFPQDQQTTVPNLIINKKPYKCPICGGNGLVPSGFYTSTGSSWTSNATTEKCRTCNGTGVVWG